MKFDVDLCTIVVNGRVVPRWNSVTAEYTNKRWTGYDAGSGQSYRGKNPSKRGTIRITMPIVNGMDDYFDNLARSDAVFPVSITDRSDAARHAIASEACIDQHAPMDRKGKDDSEVVGEILCLDLDIGGARTPNDEVAPLPT